MPHPDDFGLDELTLRAALDLDEDEQAYLASLDLASAWRAQPENATDSRWGWLGLLGIVAAFIGWTLAAGSFGDLLSIANEVGLSTVLLTTAVQLVLDAGLSLFDISTNPALGLSEPLLAALALALLFWPRLKSATHTIQGVPS